MSGTAAELARRVTMAVAEAGYPHVRARVDGDEVSLPLGKEGVPDEVCWRAFRVSGYRPHPCFECWDQAYGDECTSGRCRSGIGALT